MSFTSERRERGKVLAPALVAALLALVLAWALVGWRERGSVRPPPAPTRPPPASPTPALPRDRSADMVIGPYPWPAVDPTDIALILVPPTRPVNLPRIRRIALDLPFDDLARQSVQDDESRSHGTIKPGPAEEPSEGDDETSPRVEEIENKVEPELAPDEPKTDTELDSVRLYGSLRLRARWEEDDGEVTLSGRDSRFGARSKHRLSYGAVALAQIEGVYRPLEDDDVVLRLAFAGADTEHGRFSFGKQWSAYRVIGVFTDRLPAFDGQAGGVFNIGDGTISGTGRAGSAFQYRQAYGQLKLVAQTQFRDRSPRDQIFDTVSAVAIYKSTPGFDFGLAFNQVRDGVVDPDVDAGQAKKGDRAIIAGGRYRGAKLYVAGVYAWTRNHERDDLDRFFDGGGLELHGSYRLKPHIYLRASYNYLRPLDPHPGEYDINFVVGGFKILLPKSFEAHFYYRFDASRNSDGSPQGDAADLRVHFNF